MSDTATLAQLRSDPDGMFARADFAVDTGSVPGGALGGPCRLDCEPLAARLFSLQVRPGQGDYVFPYASMQDGGVGTCAVPIAAPDGTIVVTGGMNGCALHVSRTATHLHFFHELNGRAMNGKLVPGAVVSQVMAPQYMGVDDQARTLVARYAASGTMAMPVYHLLTIRRGAVWKIFASAVMQRRASNTGASLGPQAFLPRASKLVGQFDA